jgi:hypothetical protein
MRLHGAGRTTDGVDLPLLPVLCRCREIADLRAAPPIRVRQGAWALGDCSMVVGQQRRLRDRVGARVAPCSNSLGTTAAEKATSVHTLSAGTAYRSALHAALTLDPTVPSLVSSSRWAASEERRTGARVVVDGGQGGRRRQRLMTVTRAWRGWPWIALW